MTKSKQRTLVTFLLDRTGSMESIKDDTIGAFNAYVGGLKKSPEIDFTLVQFDSQGLDKVCVAVPINKAPTLDNGNYVPRASTPLIDAAYKTIKAVETSIGGHDVKPKIVICIQTDGQENCSTEHSWNELNALIKEKTKAGWQFNFMGASIDAYKQGTLMGISAANTMSYDSTQRHTTMAAFASAASNTADYSTGTTSNTAFSPHQKFASGDAFDPALKTHQKTTTPPAIPQPPKPKIKAVDDFTL